jgi:ribonucleoside-diphosphate reductase alpha chain
VSGGISKTLNLPASTTVEQIESLFLAAWRAGLKSLAVYRDGSKSTQPLERRCVVDASVDGCCG